MRAASAEGRREGQLALDRKTGAATQADAMTVWFLRRGSAPAARFGEQPLKMTRLGQHSRWLTHVLESGSGAPGFNGDAGVSGPHFCSNWRHGTVHLPSLASCANKTAMRRPRWWSRSDLPGASEPGTRSARAGSKKMPGGCGSRPRDGAARPRKEESPGLSILHRATRCSAGRQCSHQRQRAAQAGGLGVRRGGGTSPKARTTPQVSAPLHVCLGASRARPPPD